MATTYVTGPWNITSANHRYSALLDQAGISFADGITSIEDVWDYDDGLKPSLANDSSSLNSGIWKVDCSDAQKTTIETFCSGDANYTASDTEPSPDAAWTAATVPTWRDLNANVAATPKPMVGDESFNPLNLNATAQTWYTRLTGMDVTALPIYNNVYNATNDGTGADVLDTFLHVITPLLCALRVTGALAILDMIDVLMERAKNPLITNSYFLTLNHRAVGGISALVHQMAQCYTLNAAKTSPAEIDYSARATQWVNYANNTFKPAMDLIYNNGFPADSLRHFTTAGIRGMVYHYKRTGEANSWRKVGGFATTWDSGYKGYDEFLQAENRTDINPSGTSANGLQLSGNRYIWDHRTPFPNLSAGSLGWQPTNYAAYTLAHIVDLALEGIHPYSDTEMAKYAQTALYVMTDFATTGFIRENVNSATVNETFTINDLTTGNWGVMYGLGKWLTNLRTYGDSTWTALAGANNVVVPAWMLFATA